MRLVVRGDEARRRSAETKRLRTRQALLEGARTLLQNRCFWPNVKMEEIASAAGVSLASAYNHFPSKQALTEELIRYSPFSVTVEDVEKIVREHEPNPVLQSVLSRLIMASWDHFATMQLTNSVEVGLQGVIRSDYIDSVARVMTAAIIHDQRRGAIDREFDPSELGRYHAIALLANIADMKPGTTTHRFTLIADQLIKSLLWPPRGTSRADTTPPEGSSAVDTSPLSNSLVIPDIPALEEIPQLGLKTRIEKQELCLAGRAFEGSMDERVNRLERSFHKLIAWLGKAEEKIYGAARAGGIAPRLEHLENTMYGFVQVGTFLQRVSRLDFDLYGDDMSHWHE